MNNVDGERIAPVTYLFGARSDAQPAGTEPQGKELRPPSAVAEPDAARHPVFVDLGDPDAADDRVASVRVALENEARQHLSRNRRESSEPRKKGSFDRVNNVSMHALARRGMSSREMRDYLVGREFSPEETDQEVERLESVGLLDDVLLAETLVRTLRDRKGYGRSALTGELRRRHVDPLAIELALEALDDDELERATEIAHKRASQLRSYDAETAKRRLGAFLMRKGYSGSVVSTAVQRALAPAGPTFR